MELIGKFLEYLAAEKGSSERTISMYKLDLTDFRAFYATLDEELDWTTVDSDVVRRWMAQRMEGGLSPRSMKRSLSAVRSFYRYLMRMGMADFNPAHSVPNPKTDKPLPVFVKEQEMDALLEMMKEKSEEGFVACRDRLILLMFYTTGIRLAELVGLDVEAVSLPTGELKVRGKRNKERIVPFGSELAEAVSAYLPQRQERTESVCGPLFVREDGSRMRDKDVRETVKLNLSLVTTQERRGPHTLRHTFATVMLNNGAELEAVKELLGHENLATTEVYTHTTFAELKKEYEQAHPRA